MLAAPFPPGGIHADHVIVPLHFHDRLDPGRYDRADRIAAALAVARS